MKLLDISKKAIKLLQEAGEKGINNIELAEKLQIPRRRVYDIITILKAADLVESTREKGGTFVSWGSIPSIEPVPQTLAEDTVPKKVKSEINKLKEENSELKEKIKKLRGDLSKGGLEKASKKTLFETDGIKIRADKTLKITEVVNSGIEVSIKASGKGIIVEPQSND
ncbi:MAG: hypothetical protein ACTSQI_05250 [Candidatus Helarchaeota archaeon]